jgi:cytochrome P450 monooxygenase
MIETDLTDTAPVVEFPMRRPGAAFPPAEYAHYREHRGLVRSTLADGNLVWLVTRLEDVREVLASPKISADPSREGFPYVGPTLGVPRQDQIPGWFVGLDSPEHDRFRKVLIPEFAMRRVRDMRPAIQRVVDERIDAMLESGNSADLVADFALPVPSLVISALLGVPPVDRGFFESRTRPLVSIRTSTDEEREKAVTELLRYINRLVAIKEKWPGDDLISRLLATGVLSAQELAGTLLLLLIAGHETTADNIALGAVTLMANPEWIGDDRVVEELLRIHSVADLVSLRVAAEDVEIGGQLIRAGEGIVPLIAAANHDEAAFACPHEFDPTRTAARQNVAFGHGMHKCLGQNLARVELEIAYRTLFERIPKLEIAVPLEELPVKYDGVIFGLHELPVRW